MSVVMAALPDPSNASTSPRRAWCGAYLALGVLAACASKPAPDRDAAALTSDGLVVSAMGRDSGDAPTMSATGDLPFGWKSSVPIGTPGWRNTPTPLCDVQQGWFGFWGVWADPRGVFVLGENYCYDDDSLAGCPSDGQDARTTLLVFNDGSGWRNLFEDTSGSYFTATLTGILNGPIVLAGNGCALLRGPRRLCSCLPATAGRETAARDLIPKPRVRAPFSRR